MGRGGVQHGEGDHQVLAGVPLPPGQHSHSGMIRRIGPYFLLRLKIQVIPHVKRKTLTGVHTHGFLWGGVHTDTHGERQALPPGLKDPLTGCRPAVRGGRGLLRSKTPSPGDILLTAPAQRLHLQGVQCSQPGLLL